MAASRIVPAWLSDYHRATRDPATNALAVLPLLLLYGLGLAQTGAAPRSSVDWVSAPWRDALPLHGYLALQVGLALLLVAWAAWRLRQAIGRRFALAGPVAAEASLYGAGLGGLILLLLDQAHALGVSGDLSGLFERAVASAGAGLHEELVFRLLLLSLIAVALQRAFELPRPFAVLVAVALSSLVFAAAHHLAGEPLDLFAFAYRTTAGLLFAGLFLARGFAVAAWTHASYDFYLLAL